VSAGGQEAGDGAARYVVPCDYDSDPSRFAAVQTVRQQFADGEVFAPVARRLAAIPQAGPVLELGGGTGPLARQLSGAGVPVVVADLAAHVAQAPCPAVRTDATALGFRQGSFGTVAALWMLYHLPTPVAAIREAARVLRPGGWFVACAPSRFNDPELEGIVSGWGRPLAFDAENGADQTGAVFEVRATHTWDRPLVHLPSHGAVEIYLRSRGMAPEAAASAARQVPVPLHLTKRGMIIWARKR
jgi:SAM-dependent methyltransferase